MPYPVHLACHLHLYWIRLSHYEYANFESSEKSDPFVPGDALRHERLPYDATEQQKLRCQHFGTIRLCRVGRVAATISLLITFELRALGNLYLHHPKPQYTSTGIRTRNVLQASACLELIPRGTLHRNSPTTLLQDSFE
jgi:hypothetical protein